MMDNVYFSSPSSIPRSVAVPQLVNHWGFGFVLKAGLLLFLLLCLPLSQVAAATINVDADCSLAEAIDVANGTTAHADCETSSDAADVIIINGDITLSANLPQVTSEIEIRGNNNAIDGADTYSIFDISSSGNLTIKNIRLRNGVREKGGAIYSEGAFSLYDSIVSDNTATGGGGTNAGGGIYIADNSTATIDQSSITGNSSATGGGVFCSLGSTVTISNSAMAGNTVDSGGGGMFVSDCLLSITNSTIYNNSAAKGGGFHLAFLNPAGDSYSFDFSHLTITGNTANTGAGINSSGSGQVLVNFHLKNSIVYGNNGVDCRYSTPGTNVGNLYATGDCGAASLTDDPQLGAVTGSPAYFPLPADSPAVDAGSASHCKSTDQLGKSRPVGAGCDIGAFEYRPPAAPSRSRDGSSGSTGSSDSAATTEKQFPLKKTFSTCMLGLPSSIEVFGVASNGTQCQQLDGAGVGIPALIEAGFINAVDVWGYLGAGVEICFRASGSLVFLDAANMPRYPEPMPAYDIMGMTCGFVSRPGSVVLMPGPAPAPRVKIDVMDLSGCMVTTTHIVNFRKSRGGEVILHLPYDVTLTALSRTAEWFEVDYHGLRGWVNTEYLTAEGSCG